MSIDDQHDLSERLDRAVGAIRPGTAPVDGVMRRGRVIRWRRRSVAVASVAAVVAAGAIAAPSLRQAAVQNPATSHYTVTVQPPGPNALPGVFARGTVNGKGWQLAVGQTGTDGAERGQQMTIAAGPAFGLSGTTLSSPAFTTLDSAPASFLEISGGSSQAEYGPVATDVSYLTVRLGNGTVLTLHPVKAYGVRLVGFALPLGAPVVSVTAYSARGEIATAVAFNGIDQMPSIATWLKPGQHGLPRATEKIGSGSYLGKAWSMRAYVGPWGICVIGKAGGTSGSGCIPTATTTTLGTSALPWTAGVPGVALGIAAQPVTRVVVTSPGGKTTPVRPVTVGGVRLFAFPLGRGPKPWKWTAYDSSGHVITSGKVTPQSQ